MRTSLCMCIMISLCGCTKPVERDDPRPVKDVSALEQKLAANPEDAQVNLALGDRAAAGGDWLRAEQYYARAEALGRPEAEMVQRLLRVLVMAHRYDEALERCHRRLSHVPDDRGTRLVEAAILEALERPRDAERELTTLVRTRPDDPNPYLALGKLYRDSYHDSDKAREMFEKYLSLSPKGDEADAIRYQLEEQRP